MFQTSKFNLKCCLRKNDKTVEIGPFLQNKKGQILQVLNEKSNLPSFWACVAALITQEEKSSEGGRLLKTIFSNFRLESFLKWAIPGLFFFIFDIVDSEQNLPMIGFEPRISGVGSDPSTNWGTTSTIWNHFFEGTLKICEQWLWQSWQSCCFKPQSSRVWIQSLGILIFPVNCIEKTKSDKETAGMNFFRIAL